VDQVSKGMTTGETHFPMEETLKQIKTKTVEAYDSSVQLVRRNPIKSVAVALGVGALAGYFFVVVNFKINFFS